jgi:hypothetical protein
MNHSSDALGVCVLAVRAREDKQVLGDNESYEAFQPTFTYPVRVLCAVTEDRHLT